MDVHELSDDKYLEKYLKYKKLYKNLKELMSQGGGAKKISKKKMNKNKKHKGDNIIRIGDIVTDINSGYHGVIRQLWANTLEAVQTNSAYLDKYLVQFNNGETKWKFGFELFKQYHDLIALETVNNQYYKVPTDPRRFVYVDPIPVYQPNTYYHEPLYDEYDRPRKRSIRRKSNKHSRKQKGGADTNINTSYRPPAYNSDYIAQPSASSVPSAPPAPSAPSAPPAPSAPSAPPAPSALSANVASTYRQNSPIVQFIHRPPSYVSPRSVTLPNKYIYVQNNNIPNYNNSLKYHYNDPSSYDPFAPVDEILRKTSKKHSKKHSRKYSRKLKKY
jgi:hypothetical protein